MMPPSGDLSKDRKVEQKVEVKKKTQAEIEQEMATLQYTNPMLLEVRDSSTFMAPSLPSLSLVCVSVVCFKNYGSYLSLSQLFSTVRIISVSALHPFKIRALRTLTLTS